MTSSLPTQATLTVDGVRMNECNNKTVEVPMPQILKETVEEGCTVKQMVDISVSNRKAEIINFARCFDELVQEAVR